MPNDVLRVDRSGLADFVRTAIVDTGHIGVDTEFGGDALDVSRHFRSQ